MRETHPCLVSTLPWHSCRAAAMSSALRTSVMLIFHLFTQNKQDVVNGKQKHARLGGPQPPHPQAHRKCKFVENF